MYHVYHLCTCDLKTQIEVTSETVVLPNTALHLCQVLQTQGKSEANFQEEPLRPEAEQPLLSYCTHLKVLFVVIWEAACFVLVLRQVFTVQP